MNLISILKVLLARWDILRSKKRSEDKFSTSEKYQNEKLWLIVDDSSLNANAPHCNIWRRLKSYVLIYGANLRQFLSTDSPLKMMKNAFYFMLSFFRSQDT